MSKFTDGEGFAELSGGVTSTFTETGIGTTSSIMGSVMSVIRDRGGRSLGDVLVNISTEEGRVERIIAQPIGRHHYTCPLPNELIHCVQHQSNGDWFYTGIVSNEHNINHMLNGNIVTTNNTTNDISTGQSFIAHPDSARAVDIFEGDTVIQGRNGTSVRLSHSNPAFVNPWNTGERKETTPIILMRAGHLPVESLYYDYSSLYLTSDQNMEIPFPTEIPDIIDNETYGKAQLIGFSDRVVLGSRSDDIVLSSGATIQLLTRQWQHDVDVVLDTFSELIVEIKKIVKEVKVAAETSAKQTFIIPGVGTTGTTTQMPRYLNINSNCIKIDSAIDQINQNLEKLRQK